MLRLTAGPRRAPGRQPDPGRLASVAVQTAPPAVAAPPPATTTTSAAAPAEPATTGETTTGPDVAPVGDLPSERPKQQKGAAAASGPLYDIHPKLTAGRLRVPRLRRRAPTSDTFGAARSDGAYHHGDDIFGQLGQPLVACADRTVFSVGWNRIGGNRLWIVDAAGNQFYYAHLSAFATTAANGAHVKAGQVVGFMGNTGDAEGTPVHLHFEVHPVSLLYLGYDGAVDPTPYLDAWRHAAGPAVPDRRRLGAGSAGAGPRPSRARSCWHDVDISTANGLDPSSLRRALTAPKTLDAAARARRPWSRRRTTSAGA